MEGFFQIFALKNALYQFTSCSPFSIYHTLMVAYFGAIGEHDLVKGLGFDIPDQVGGPKDLHVQQRLPGSEGESPRARLYPQAYQQVLLWARLKS